MALKFLNKKGWHTGSLRNIENVWKAEQKHEGEQRKLEELREQIKEERERAEFRRIQEEAGLAPRQERLDFLYESGLAVGKGSSSEGFKSLQAPTAASSSAAVPAEGSSSKAAVPGALFEDKPQSANDTWRKLHSDPLLLIRQREQEALARIKNNPIKMAMIKKSVEAEKKQKQDKEKRKKKKHKEHSRSKNDKETARTHSDTEVSHDEKEERGDHSKSGRQEDNIKRDDDDYRKIRKESDLTSERLEIGKSKHEKHSSRYHSDSEERNEGEEQKRKGYHSRHDQHIRQVRPGCEEEQRKDRDDKTQVPRHIRHSKHDRDDRRVDSDSRYRNEENESKRDPHDRYAKQDRNVSRVGSDSRYRNEENESKRDRHDRYAKQDRNVSRVGSDSRYTSEESGRKHDRLTSEHHRQSSELGKADKPIEESKNLQHSYNRRRGAPPKMSEEERAARLKEMQMDAELHEEQRWKRLKKAEEADDAREAMTASTTSRGKNFLDAAQKSIYGAEEGGSTTIEESVRRRTYYSQGSSANESNAFRR